MPNCFLVIRLLAKSRLGISLRRNGADETNYVSLVGKILLILINREKMVRRKKLQEFNLLVEHKGCTCFLGSCGCGGFVGVHDDDSILV